MKQDTQFDVNKYKFSEGQLLEDLTAYIQSTYSEHYSKNKFQSTEFIIDCGHGEGFALGNVLKYVQRYGKKGGKNRADLLKVLHYALIALSVHDSQFGIVLSEAEQKTEYLRDKMNAADIDQALDYIDNNRFSPELEAAAVKADQCPQIAMGENDHRALVEDARASIKEQKSSFGQPKTGTRDNDSYRQMPTEFL